jgi:hypothetical protein
MTPDRRLARHFLLVALTLGGLYLAGRGRLVPPPMTHPSRLPAWWTGLGPLAAVFSAARVALLIGGLYWLSLLGLVAAVVALSPRRLVRAAPSRRLIGARRAVRLALGASALGSALAGGASPVFAAPAPGPGPAPTITNLTGPGQSLAGPPVGSRTAAPVQPVQPVPPMATQPGASGPDRSGGATATGAAPAPRLGPTGQAAPAPTPAPMSPAQAAQSAHYPGPPGRSPAAPRGPGRPAPPEDAAASPSPPPVASAGGDDPTVASEWIVRPGDNLWFIAEQTLAGAWGRAPSDRQVGGYWISVIAANQSRLPDPSDPSLLFAGDVVILPPLPSR